MKLLDIYSRLKEDIAYIEQELEKSVLSELPLLTETSLHLLKAGGKRLRPVFVLLSGRFGGYDLERLKSVAVALELIHMASLVHDDVIDDANLRRGKLTVKSKWDNRVAMYTGDYIFAKALTVMTELENPDIHRALSRAIVQMSIGEMEQIRFFFNTEQTVRDYLLRIRRKTALLIAVSCELGGMAAEAPPEAVRALYAYGYNVGMAFQIRDDILDLTGSEKQLGKPPGSDIKQGNITLPVILSLCDAGMRDSLLADIRHIQQTQDKEMIDSLVARMRKSPGMKQSEKLAAQYIEKALKALKRLPDNEASRNLREIAFFVGNRSF